MAHDIVNDIQLPVNAGSVTVPSNSSKFYEEDMAAVISFLRAIRPAFDSAGRIYKGSSGDPIISNTASYKFNQMYLQSGATSGTSVALYIREYLTGAGGSNALARFYTDVVGVAAGTAQGMQCTLGFGEGTTTGSVSGLGVAGRFQIGLANIAYPGTGTLAVVQSEIYSFGANADPAGNAIAMFAAVNDGHADGMADVDDDAVLFHLRGFTSGTGNMMVKAASPGAMGSATYSIRCKMSDGVLAYLNFTAAAVTA